MFALTAMCTVYAGALTLLGINRYAAYHSGADLGEFVQTIATPFSGFGDTPEGGSHFLHHFSPLLYLFSPVLLLAHSPVALIALQAIGGALVAPPIYLLVRKRAGEGLALLAGVRNAALSAARRRNIHRLPRERLRTGGDRVARLGGRFTPLAVGRPVRRARPRDQRRRSADVRRPRRGLCDLGTA